MQVSTGSDKEMRYVRSFEIAERRQLSLEMQNLLFGRTAIFVPTIDAVCPLGECMLYANDKTPMSWDYGHFTVAGSRFVINALKATGKLELP